MDALMGTLPSLSKLLGELQIATCLSYLLELGAILHALLVVQECQLQGPIIQIGRAHV